MDMTMIVCPRHEGAYDCTPFCDVCEGNQEYVFEQAAICSVCGDQLDQETGYHIMETQIICAQCIESEETK